MSFEKFNLHAKIFAGVQSQGYIKPTPIQLESIPPIMEGRDVMGLAQTGTGKTAAFVLPILQRLMQGERGHVRALIIAPTRELSEQTHKAIGQLGRRTELKSASIYGGVSIQGQIKKLRDKVEIITACPGRLLDHINRGTVDLSKIEVLVLDEADHMFDMGFLPDIRRIVKHLPAKRQTLLFSATMPDDIRALANDLLQNPVNIKIGFTAPVESVTHRFYPVPMESKTALLKDILDKTDTESVLVFTRTKSRAKSLARQLDSSGYKVTSLHGNLTQPKRQQALDGFRDGRYDMPSTADAYTHRIGRTGRAAKTGDAFTFVTGQDVVLAHSLKKVLGEKLQYHSVDGLTITLPLTATPAPARRNNNSSGRKPDKSRRPFTISDKSNRNPRQRSFSSANRQSWAH